MTTIAIAVLSGGLVMLLVSLPLLYRKTPMNHFYGIRIRAAFESEQRWYDINAYGGRQMMRWSWLVITTGFLGFFVTPEHLVSYAWICLPITLLAIIDSHGAGVSMESQVECSTATSLAGSRSRGIVPNEKASCCDLFLIRSCFILFHYDFIFYGHRFC